MGTFPKIQSTAVTPRNYSISKYGGAFNQYEIRFCYDLIPISTGTKIIWELYLIPQGESNWGFSSSNNRYLKIDNQLIYNDFPTTDRVEMTYANNIQWYTLFGSSGENGTVISHYDSKSIDITFMYQQTQASAIASNSVEINDQTYWYAFGGTKTITLSPLSYNLTTVVSPSNTGTISGSGTYTYGSSYELSATPSSGYRFQNWTGDISSTQNPYISTMPSQNLTVTGNFQKAGFIKVYTASSPSWVDAQVKICTNTNPPTWTTAVVKKWNGSQWVLS